jgi:hypothetical protein
MKSLLFILILVPVATYSGRANDRPQWPASPQTARVVFEREIRCDELNPSTGFFGKLGRLLGGSTEDDRISLPFDVVATNDRLFMTCQNLPALIEVNLEDGTFRRHRCKELPFLYPIALAVTDDGRVLVSDSERGAVYLFDGKKVVPLIAEGLSRPTGLAVIESAGRLYVVDTGEHLLKVFDLEGNPIVVKDGNTSPPMHYPTFAEATADGRLMVNDALNYCIRTFDTSGALLSSFGAEGDAPGYLSRPKGIGRDSDGHIYIVDTMQDNIQVFDSTGRLLLVIGGPGQQVGRFWSPSGVDIHDDLVYVADTYNDRIQVLRYLGDSE